MVLLNYRGVAQLAECLVWDQEAVSSRLTTPTTVFHIPRHKIRYKWERKEKET